MSHLKAGEYRIILYSDNSFISVEAGNEEHLTVQVDAPDPNVSIEWTIEPGAKDGQYYIKNKMHNSYAVWKPHCDSDEVTSASSTTLDDDAKLWKIVSENDGLHRICPATSPDRCWSVEDSMLGRLIVLSMPMEEGTALWQFQQVGGQQSDETSCGCCRCRCERVRNNNDLNLPTLQELIAEYRCNEISTIVLAEFNERAKSPVLEADRRQMMMRNWRTAALARYDRDASRYHQGVYQRIRTNLIASLDATLFLGHLRKLRKTYLLAFKKEMLDGLHSEGISFADVVSEARERCLGCFETGAKEAMAEGQDWIWEDEMISLKEEVESIAAQCRKDETKKMVNLIERNFKKQISGPVELALDKAASDMWDDILRTYKQTLVKAEAQHWAKATSFDCTEEEKVTALAVLRRRAWQGLRAKIDEQTAEPVILGKLREHFEKRFRYNETGAPRVWKPEDDIDGVFKKARDETLDLIRLYSNIQPLDPLLEYKLPADSIALPADSLSDEDFDFAATLVVITKTKGDGLMQKFRREADAYCAEAKHYERVRNNDLNLRMQQELIAEYRCNEISTIVLARFNERAKSPVLEDRRQMMMRNWRTAALARYDRDASRYHQGVYQRIRTNLIASLDATLFLGHLRKLRKTYLLAFKKEMLDGLHSEGIGFAAVVSKARNRCLGCFETEAKEAMVEGQDWIWEDEMISLKEEVESIAVQCRKDETKKMVNLIERNFKKQISGPVELALDNAASDMWDDILCTYKQRLVEAEAQYWAKATSFDCTEEEKVTALAVLRRRAWRGLRAKIDEQTTEPVILGKLREHFEKRFRYDETGVPRVWKPEDDIDGVFKKARDETLDLIRLYSNIQPLDPLLEYKLPADSIALPADSLSDEDFDFAATLVVITKTKGDGLMQKFRREADAYCAEAKRYEPVRNNNDLNLQCMQQESIAEYRGNEISTIVEFNERAKSPVLQDHRQMMMRSNWRAEALVVPGFRPASPGVGSPTPSAGRAWASGFGPGLEFQKAWARLR